MRGRRVGEQGIRRPGDRKSGEQGIRKLGDRPAKYAKFFRGDNPPSRKASAVAKAMADKTADLRQDRQDY